MRVALPPLLSAQLLSGLLTMVSTYVVLRTDDGLAVTGVMIVIFQYLVGEAADEPSAAATGSRRSPPPTRSAGVANRERFQARLEQEIVAARESGASIPVMLLDLDHFKEINDTLGHHYGDQLLRRARPTSGARGWARRAGRAAGRRRVRRVPGRADRRSRAPAQDRDLVIDEVQRPFGVEHMTL